MRAPSWCSRLKSLRAQAELSDTAPFTQVRVTSLLSMKPPCEALKAETRRPSVPLISGMLRKPS